MNNRTFDILQQLFTNNGFHSNGITVKLTNPSTFLIKAEDTTVSLIFQNESFPIVTYKKEINKYFSPSLSRYLMGITFDPKNVTFLLKNWPDLTLTYDELGV